MEFLSTKEKIAKALSDGKQIYLGHIPVTINLSQSGEMSIFHGAGTWEVSDSGQVEGAGGIILADAPDAYLGGYANTVKTLEKWQSEKELEESIAHATKDLEGQLYDKDEEIQRLRKELEECKRTLAEASPKPTLPVVESQLLESSTDTCLMRVVELLIEADVEKCKMQNSVKYIPCGSK